MKRVIAIALALLSCIFFLFYLNKISFTKKKFKTNSTYNYSIAILTPTSHPALEEIENGFKETVSENEKSLTFKTFNANGNKSLLRAQAEEIVNGSFDLVCTIGAQCSEIISQLIKKKHFQMVHVFCGIEGKNFAMNLHTNNPLSTGVYLEADYKKYASIIHTINPSIKKILLVYDPTHGIGLENDRKKLERELSIFDIKLSSVEIFNSNEIQQKTASLIPSHDMVIIFTDNTVVSGIDGLITLCNRNQVPLFASDQESGKKGATFAYGIPEKNSGIEAGKQALQILFDKEQAQNIVPHAIDSFYFYVNPHSATLQNIKISQEHIDDINKRALNA